MNGANNYDQSNNKCVFIIWYKIIVITTNNIYCKFKFAFTLVVLKYYYTY